MAVSVLLFLIWLVLCCGYALLRGGAPERVAAGLLVLSYALGLPVHWMIDAAGYRSAVIGTATIDVLLLVALIVLAWRSTRFWPLWVAGWQLAAIVAHLAKLLDPAMLATGYAIQAQIWAYPMVLATAAGAWRHRDRRRSGDPDPPWKSSPGIVPA
ncbi:hypothetical protein ASG11_11215 [Sphingomonas sp. Leaf357]|nr:hypothetical protein ASG11_11215 [Sphingomonas sp. Leaf357]